MNDYPHYNEYPNYMLVRFYGRCQPNRTAKQVKADYNMHLQKHCLSKTKPH